jgi:hypothetical protein
VLLARVRRHFGDNGDKHRDHPREDDATIDFSMSEENDRVAMLSDLTAVVKQLETRISEEGAATRTHFNVMAERVESAVTLVAEVNSHHSTVLDDHENRGHGREADEHLGPLAGPLEDLHPGHFATSGLVTSR